ncbi:hypothetical protein [Burkholderia gladioli]|uniref:Uncharacterized protein n=2 Tax=Burkholderia gladioli TaxID=28095 RepID=A0AB38U644_BURGA|nr:hypothetical protein [Burkholderia gladioli]UWX75446.1 hypothetical protein NYZ96_36105 [Burkholderia gladioli]
MQTLIEPKTRGVSPQLPHCITTIGVYNMGQTIQFVSKDAVLNSNIESAIEKISATTPLSLPGETSDIVSSYIEKIQGNYNVDRAKQDTESAINLMYIAYNTTPQEEAETRKKIEDVAEELKTAQEDSALAMQSALTAATGISQRIHRSFDEWIEVRAPLEDANESAVGELKDYLKDDLLDLAEKIKKKSILLKEDLEKTSTLYESIIKNILTVTQNSELLLSERLKDKQRMKEEILKMKAREHALEKLVEELKADVKRYNDMAAEFEKRATTAEERAFILSLVQIGAQVIAAALPPIAAAATASSTGGGSVVASGVASTMTRSKDTLEETAGDSKGEHTGGKKTEKLREKAEAQEKLELLNNEITELSGEIESLKASKSKEEKPNTKGRDDKHDGHSSEDAGHASSLDERIQTKEGELEKKKKERNTLSVTLASLSDSIAAFDRGLDKVVEKYEGTARSLREMQMKMLDKAEEFEKAKREQNSELDEIRVLLAGKRDKEESLQLTIRSLNLSVTALKRAKEIVDELSLFFKFFAAFMERTIEEIKDDIEECSKALEKKKLRPSAITNLVKLGDRFFICRQAEWHAINTVCSKFLASFDSGAHLSIRLMAIYLSEDELRSYLKTVPETLQKIIDSRKAASTGKIQNLADYRKDLQQGVVG